ncbi:MAG: B12-binding domain-containing radical SAM protein, partial [Flavobacteriales bacterium]
MKKLGVVLFNPRSANSKHRIPNSILQVGASIHGKRPYVFVDGNKETDPYLVIANHLKTGDFGYFGTTVMPGPQLKQAIPFSKKVKDKFPNVTNVWGGYFASNQHNVVLKSGYVDYVINGPGDNAFPNLLEALDVKNDVNEIRNLIYLKDGAIHKTKKEELLDQDSLPAFPYDQLDLNYPIRDYLGKTFMGNKTLSYHSSFGCPFTCSFCAVVPIYNARWKGRSAENIYADVSKM